MAGDRCIRGDDCCNEMGLLCICEAVVSAWQAIEVFKEKVARLKKRVKRAKELESRRLRRLERRTGAKSSAPARVEVLQLCSLSCIHVHAFASFCERCPHQSSTAMACLLPSFIVKDLARRHAQAPAWRAVLA